MNGDEPLFKEAMPAPRYCSPAYVYIKSEPTLWTVGFADGDRWLSESDWLNPEAAAIRVRYLNGGDITPAERKFLESSRL